MKRSLNRPGWVGQKTGRMPFSSARAHIEGRDDILIKSKPMTDRISKPWGMFLSDDVGEDEMDHFRKLEASLVDYRGAFLF